MNQNLQAFLNRVMAYAFIVAAPLSIYVYSADVPKVSMYDGVQTILENTVGSNLVAGAVQSVLYQTSLQGAQDALDSVSEQVVAATMYAAQGVSIKDTQTYPADKMVLGVPQKENSYACPFMADAKRGTRDGQVSKLQAYLISTGDLKKGNDTSYYGDATKKAVASWQEKNDITPATGFFGPLTRAKMCAEYLTEVNNGKEMDENQVMYPPQPIKPMPEPLKRGDQSATNTDQRTIKSDDQVVVSTKNSKPATKAVPEDIRNAVKKIGYDFYLNQGYAEQCTGGDLKGDYNADGMVDVWDIALVGTYYNQDTPREHPKLDINKDGKVAFDELLVVSQDFGKYNCIR